jgi:lipid-A-disaccharide synthase
MQIFLSAGEPSGDLHGSNLAAALRSRCPELCCVGYGGSRMEAAGCRLLFPLAELPVMWFRDVFSHLRTFFRLIDQADEYFRDQRPDAVVLIDYPGFHWWLAKRARQRGIPVFYFVPPQLWAWAGWRVRKMRRYVDHVLCTLPFEEQWYRQRGVHAHYVGHPYFDDLTSSKLDGMFIQEQRARPGRVVAILPGSRTQELEYNLASQMRTADILHRRYPDVRFLAAAFNEEQKRCVAEAAHRLQLPVEVFSGYTAEIIHLAHVCMAVSGSVSLELLHACVPSVVLYRVHRVGWLMSRGLRTSRWISLVNLLANEELFPEFLSRQCPAEPMAAQLANWLRDEDVCAQMREKLASLRNVVGQPGACDRAAEYIQHKLSPTALEVIASIRTGSRPSGADSRLAGSHPALPE